jgi:hypothetical protein
MSTCSMSAARPAITSAATRTKRSMRASTSRRPRRTVTPFDSVISQAPRGSSLSAASRSPARAGAPARRGSAARRRLGAGRAVEARQLRRQVPRAAHEQLAARVEQAVLAPARRRDLLDHLDDDRVRPAALHARAVDPGQRLDAACAGDRGRPSGSRRRCPAHHLLDLDRRDALERSLEQHALDRLVEAERQQPGQPAERGDGRGGARRGAASRARAARSACLPAFVGGCVCAAGIMARRFLTPARARSSSRARASTARRSRCPPRGPPSARGCGRSCPARC